MPLLDNYNTVFFDTKRDYKIVHVSEKPEV